MTEPAKKLVEKKKSVFVTFSTVSHYYKYVVDDSICHIIDDIMVGQRFFFHSEFFAVPIKSDNSFFSYCNLK